MDRLDVHLDRELDHLSRIADGEGVRRGSGQLFREACRPLRARVTVHEYSHGPGAGRTGRGGSARARRAVSVQGLPSESASRLASTSSCSRRPISRFASAPCASAPISTCRSCRCGGPAGSAALQSSAGGRCAVPRAAIPRGSSPATKSSWIESRWRCRDVRHVWVRRPRAGAGRAARTHPGRQRAHRGAQPRSLSRRRRGGDQPDGIARRGQDGGARSDRAAAERAAVWPLWPAISRPTTTLPGCKPRASRRSRSPPDRPVISTRR